VEGGEERVLHRDIRMPGTPFFILLIDLLIRMLFYMCELQSLRHAGQETSSKNCARASELLSFLYSLSFFGPMVSYLIIY
jgi:hypothetical protein